MREAETRPETAIDPVCEMVVHPRTARSAELRDKMYYLCSGGCRTKFVADPDKYHRFWNSLRNRSPVGDAVTGATLNGGGSFVMRKTAVGAATRLGQILRLNRLHL